MSPDYKKGYYELIEPRTLFNSVIPLILGIFYTWYNYHLLRLWPTIEMVIAMIVLQVFMNVNDGYWDYKREKAAKTGDHKKNPIGMYHLDPNQVKWFSLILFIISAICGILIGFQTNNWIIWLLGLLCYGIAIFYSTGSHTISSGPFGEIAAAFAMGLGIILVMVYINIYPDYRFTWSFLGKIILAAGIPEICNYTLLLGNNVCDYQEDINNGRHTLVSYLGIKGGLYLFVINYVLGYLLTIWAVMINILPWSVLLIVICIPLLVKNMQALWRIQNKRITFPKVVQNTQVLFITETIGFLIGIIFNFK